MRLTLTIVSVIVILLGIFMFFNKRPKEGFIIPWNPVEFTYKSYSSALAIDSKAFYDNVVMVKNAEGNCRPLYTQYRDTDTEKLQQLIKKNNTDAVMESIRK